MSYSPYDLPANQDPALRNLPENAPQSGMTLGQANPQGGPPQQPTYLDEFQRNFAGMQSILAGAQRQYIPEDSHPTIFQQIMSFGAAGANYQAYKQHYNQGVDQYNRLLTLKAAELAKEMTDSHERSLALANGETLKQLQLQLGVLGLQERVRHNTSSEHAAQVQHDIENSKPPTLEQEEMGEAHGQTWHPGSGFLPRQPGGGWGEPAARGSAFDNQLAQQGGGGATPEDANLTPAQRVRKQQTTAAAEKETATTKAKNDMLLSEAIDGLRRELQPIRKSANLILPKLTGGAVSGFAKTYAGGPVSLAKARMSSDPQARQAAENLINAGQNIIRQINVAKGSATGFRMTQAEINAFGATFKRMARGAISADEANSAIDEFNDFLDRQDPRKLTSTTTTPPSTTTPSTMSGGGTGTRRLSSGKLIQELP